MMATSLEIGHEKCRHMVCVVCYGKTSRALSASDIECIQNNVIEGYNVGNPDFPCGICTGCNIALSKKRNDHDCPLPNRGLDYNPERKIGLRSATMCTCKICHIAKLYGIEFLKYTRQQGKKRGRPSTKTHTSFKVCSNCFAKLYSGCSHSMEQCRYSRRTKVDSIIGMTSPSTLQRAASRINQEDDAVAITLGRPKKTKEEVRKELFTSDDLYGMKQDLQLSNAHTKVLAQGIRSAANSRKAIEKNAMVMVQDKNHRLDNFFEIQNF